MIENLDDPLGARRPTRSRDDHGVTQSYAQQRRRDLRRARAAPGDPQLRPLTTRATASSSAPSTATRSDILIEGNWIYGNGNVGSVYEHNTYTAAIGIVYQYNRFGPLRAGAGGNNLKDRSAGLVVRYNWIEGGNRQLDLVDAEDSHVLVDDPSYGETFVYGNVLIEPDGAGNSQIVHYGGDSGDDGDLPQGHAVLLPQHGRLASRSGNTTLLRLSTDDETRRRAQQRALRHRERQSARDARRRRACSRSRTTG